MKVVAHFERLRTPLEEDHRPGAPAKHPSLHEKSLLDSCGTTRIGTGAEVSEAEEERFERTSGRGARHRRADSMRVRFITILELPEGTLNGQV